MTRTPKPPYDAHIHTWLMECVIDIEDVERAWKLSRHVPVVLANRGIVTGDSYEQARHWWLFREGEIDGANFVNGVMVESGSK